MVEKSQLKAAPKKGDISGVKDIVRAIMTGRSMAEVNAVIEIIIGMHDQGKLEIVRIKDRFIEVANPLNRHPLCYRTHNPPLHDLHHRRQVPEVGGT